MSYYLYIANNHLLISIILFIVLYSTIHYGMPDFLYNKDGSLRQFGVGYTNKTIFPGWIMAIVLGLLCYLFILYYIKFYSIF